MTTHPSLLLSPVDYCARANDYLKQFQSVEPSPRHRTFDSLVMQPFPEDVDWIMGPDREVLWDWLSGTGHHVHLMPQYGLPSKGRVSDLLDAYEKNIEAVPPRVRGILTLNAEACHRRFWEHDSSFRSRGLPCGVQWVEGEFRPKATPGEEDPEDPCLRFAILLRAGYPASRLTQVPLSMGVYDVFVKETPGLRIWNPEQHPYLLQIFGQSYSVTANLLPSQERLDEAWRLLDSIPGASDDELILCLDTLGPAHNR